MKNNSVVLFSLILFFLPIYIVSQELPKILPPSPEAASLGKFTEVPISHYTGLTNISIPITSFAVGGKSFPVGISYHARGIRVEEIASRVGIGWALNAGGQISRQIRNQPDDGPGGYLNRANVLMDALGADNPNLNFFTDVDTRHDYAWEDTHNTYKPDRLPDQFNLQVSSLSAKFIFDYKDDKPLLQSYDNIIIQENIGSITSSEQPAGYTVSNILKGFIVTDKDGYKYYFGVSKDGLRRARNWDKNIGNYAFPQQQTYNLTSSEFNLSFNSWLLMDIESPSGELASFVYQEENSTLYRRSYDEMGNLESQYPNIAVNYSSKIESHQFQLQEIRYDFTPSNSKYKKIVFDASDPRQDLNNSKELDAIKIYDENLALIKTFNLHHSYPNTVVDNNQNSDLKNIQPVITTTEVSKRIFLDSITEIGRNGFSKPPHVFTYNNQMLPNRYSNSQDLWGYYNGGDNGNYLLFFDTVNGPVNRTVDTIKSMAGMLEHIKYPTGGGVKFTYEHNRGSLGSEFNGIKFPAVNPIKSRSFSITQFDNNIYNSYDNNYTKDVMIGEAFGPIQFAVNLPVVNSVNQNWACANPIQQDCRFQIQLKGINGNPNDYNYIYSGVQTLYVEPGEYELIFQHDSGLNWSTDPQSPNFYFFNVTMTWEEHVVDQTQHLFASGKRIKKIEFLDSGNNLISEKNYSYKDSAGNETGVILSIPVFGSLSPIYQTNWYVFERGPSIPGSPFTTYQGNTIGYQSVTEYYGDKYNNHGKTLYNFLVQKDTGDYLSYPITPPTDNEWLRGLPFSIIHYKNDNGNYKKVKETKNQYLYGNDFVNGNPNAPALLPQIFTPSSDRRALDLDLTDSSLFYDNTDTFYRLPLIHPYIYCGTCPQQYKTYHFTGGTLGNYSTTETTYDENENPTLVTEMKTEYDYDKHYQPVKVTSVSSDGIPIIQTFEYPQSALNPNNIEQDLINQNRVVQLETKTYKDENLDGHPGFVAPYELKSTTKTIYDWFASNSVLEPRTIQTSKGTESLQDRIEFKEYDSDGNILQVSRADGIDICYIYGYNNSLPVAKIENATYSQVQSYVNAIKNASNNDTTSCMLSESCNENSLRAAQNSLRNGLPNAMVTTYTYDPLIGITSMTDPKGYTVYYEYDDANRLERVKDEDGKIMSENKYHYLLDN
jgi:hypothetical protein